MKTKSLIELTTASVHLGINDLRNYAIHKVAKAQGPNDQEENALWADFIECLQEASEKTIGLKLPDLTQEEVERRK